MRTLETGLMTAPVRLPPGSPGWESREYWPPELRLLLGTDAASVLEAAVGAAGGVLERWRPRQVAHQPARSTVVQYRADVRWAYGSCTAETVVAATGSKTSLGAAVLDDGTNQVALWRWPFDPSLPGLSAALDKARVAALLDDLGASGEAVQLRVRAYRPGRRAVVEATGRRGRLFLKVVRPAIAEALHDIPPLPLWAPPRPRQPRVDRRRHPGPARSPGTDLA